MELSLDTPVSDVNWGSITHGQDVRIANMLRRNGIETVGQLRTWSRMELLSIRNMGPASVETIVETIKRAGIELAVKTDNEEVK